MARSDGYFSPGQTGNPGGRPKGLARVVRETVGADGWVAIVRAMYGIAVDEAEASRDRIAASAWLADRGFGKAQQAIDVTSDGQRVMSAAVTLPVGSMSDGDLEMMRRTLEAAEVIEGAADSE